MCRLYVIAANAADSPMPEFRIWVRVESLRLLAEECRAMADTFSTEESRAQMNRIADSYEKTARTLDEMEEHLRTLATTSG